MAGGLSTLSKQRLRSPRQPRPPWEIVIAVNPPSAHKTGQFIPAQRRPGTAPADETVVIGQPDPAPEADPRSWIGWVLPVVVAFGLGVWRLTTPALWADELATWGAVRLSWTQLWQLSHSVDAVVYPYYAVLKAYTAIAGTSTAALRLPSVVAVALAALVVTALGRRIAGMWAGTIGGLLFAVLPVISRYAQEARPYATVMFLAALSVLCLIRLLERPTAWRIAAYAGILALTGLFHPLSGLLVLAGHAVAAIWRGFLGGWRPTLLWLPAAVAGALPMLVLSVAGKGQTAQVSWIALVNLDSLQVAPDRLFLSGATGGILIAAAILGARRDLPLLCLAGAAFVPPALLFLAGTEAHVWVARYVLAALPPMAALAGVAAVKAGRTPAVALVLVTALIGWPTNLAVRAEAGHGEASDRIAGIIGAQYRPGDVIVFPDTHPSIPWAPRDMYAHYLPADHRPADVLAVEPQRTDGHLLAQECPAAACLGKPPRIWVLTVYTGADPYQGMTNAKRAAISARYKTVQHWQYPLVSIFLLEPRTAK